MSIDTISSATLNGTWGNSTNLPVISASKWRPRGAGAELAAPATTIIVNGVSVTTRGNPTNFNNGVQKIVNSLHTDDAAAGRADAAVALCEKRSRWPATPTSAQPGDADLRRRSACPAATTTSPTSATRTQCRGWRGRLHAAYLTAAANANALGRGAVDVTLAGDA